MSSAAWRAASAHATTLRAFCAATVAATAGGARAPAALLGVDVGALAPGVAVASGLLGVHARVRATPLTVLRGGGGPGGGADGAAAAHRLRALAATHGAAALVIGWPGEGSAGVRVAAFVSAVRGAGLHLPLLLWDAAGSSVAARAALAASARGADRAGRSRAVGRAPPPPPETAWQVDMVAAQIILDDFMDAARRECLAVEAGALRR